MKFLKQENYPSELNNRFTDIFMSRVPRENLEQLKTKETNSNNRDRAQSFVDGYGYNKGNIRLNNY